MTRKEAMLTNSAMEVLLDCKARIEMEFKTIFGPEFPKTEYLDSSVDKDIEKQIETINADFEEIARLLGYIKAYAFQYSPAQLDETAPDKVEE